MRPWTRDASGTWRTERFAAVPSPAAMDYALYRTDAVQPRLLCWGSLEYAKDYARRNLEKESRP